MFKFKNFFIFGLLVLIAAGCDLKINLNSNLNQSSVQVEPNTNQNQNLNTIANENVNKNQLVANETAEFSFDLSPEKMITQIINKKSGEVYISNLKELCGSEMMLFAHPGNSIKVILNKFNPGSDKPVSELYLLNLQTKECKKLAISGELSDFGARVLSPDQSKLAVALETNEAKDLKVLDLLKDSAKTLMTLPEGETLNAGYGALSDHFEINWLDNEKIQYTVYEDTLKNYDKAVTDKIEKVIEVRIVNVQ